MYLILRALGLLVFTLVFFIYGLFFCLLRPKDPNNVYEIAKRFSLLQYVFGFRLITRETEKAKEVGPCIYIANHQSNWDMLTLPAVVRPKAVTVGKKSLVYIPFFGVIYWLSGNILIDRKNRTKAVGTIETVATTIKKDKVSVWLFPEGTRSRGRGLLPFKMGAFHAAVSAGVPVVPIVCSTTTHMDVSKGNNGHAIVEVLDPLYIEDTSKEGLRLFSVKCHDIMAKKLAELDTEVAALNTELTYRT